MPQKTTIAWADELSRGQATQALATLCRQFSAKGLCATTAQVVSPTAGTGMDEARQGWVMATASRGVRGYNQAHAAAAGFGMPLGREVIAMLLDVLHEKSEAIHAACRQFGARRIRVFGSLARGQERPDSNIDLLAYFPPGYDLFAQRLPLAERLAEITGRRLDMVPEHELNRHLREAVLNEAVDL